MEFFKVDKITRDLGTTYRYFYTVQNPDGTVRKSDLYPRWHDMINGMHTEKEKTHVEGVQFTPYIYDEAASEYAEWGSVETVETPYFIRVNGETVGSCFVLDDALSTMKSYGKGAQVENKDGTLIYGIAQ